MVKKPVFVFLFFFIYTFISCSEEPISSPPNIIYILADDLGYGDLGVFNTEGKIKTPHLDQIANEGIVAELESIAYEYMPIENFSVDSFKKYQKIHFKKLIMKQLK